MDQFQGTRLAGFVPVAGDALDAVNAGIYLGEGDPTNAALSGMAVVPLFGSPMKFGAKYGDEVLAAGRELLQGSDEAKAFLAKGPGTTTVYRGVRGEADVYYGMTNNIRRRTTEHASRDFAVRAMGSLPTRGQARAIEQALLERAERMGIRLENKVNSISLTHGYYRDVVDWGHAWLAKQGL